MQAEDILTPNLDEAAPPDTLSDEKRARQHAAVLILSLSLVLGLIGNQLFYGTPPGLNIFVFVGLLVLIAFWLLVYFERPIVAHHAIFALPAVTFALLLGVRAAPELVFFNGLALAGSLLIVLRFTGTARFLGGHWTAPLAAALQAVMIDWFDGPLTVLAESGRWFNRLELGGLQTGKFKSIARGLLITLPVVIVFAGLLGSADVLFGNLMKHAAALILPDSAAGLVVQLFLIAFFTACGLVAFKEMVLENVPVFIARLSPPAARKKPLFRLDMIEASMVLGSVNILFLVFVIIQARYFFGGQANINAEGYTYAEYARRGFYELLAVSIMTIGLIVTLDMQTTRKREEQPFFHLLVSTMIALTFVILLAAFRRLALYEEAYGFTRIRVMSAVFMIWLAILLGVLLAAVLRRRRAWFWTGALVTALGFVLSLNVLNMDGFIARRNIERFHDTGKLDVEYLLTLSDDAIPSVVRLVDNNRLNETQREQLLRGLGERLYLLDQDRDVRSTTGYHVAKSRAWHALNRQRAWLGPYLRAPYRW